MSYMQRIEGEILSQLDLLTAGETTAANVTAWVKNELLDSYKRGIATGKYDASRKMTPPKKERLAIKQS